jgi:AraC family transcriptional activator FtrA
VIVTHRYDRDVTSREGGDRRHRVATLVYDGLSPFEFAIAAEVFGLEHADLGAPWWYAFETCSAADGPLRTLGAFELIPSGGLDRLARADTVIVPGTADVTRDPPEAILDALRRAHRRGARMVSLCTGAFTLAAAGLLDGRTATTHWRQAALLARRVPDVRVTPDVLYVDDGRVLTSAGTAAGIDLCLHIVRSDHGTEIANRLARRMVVAAHREGGQAQYIERPVAGALGDALVEAAIGYARRHLGQRLTLDRIAAQVHLSSRQLSRRFVDATGSSPGDWLLRERLDASRTLLERTDDPVEAVAERVGLPNVSGYRRHFRRAYAVTPAAYRRASRVARASSSPPDDRWVG